MKALCVPVALLSVALVLSSSSGLVSAKTNKLYPKCGGKNVSQTISWKHGTHPTLIYDLPWTASALQMDCLAFEVVPVNGNSNPACTREYFEAANPFRLSLEAHSDNNQVYDWDLDDVLGASVEKNRYWASYMAGWKIFFYNNDHKNRCDMQLNIVAETSEMSDAPSSSPAPSLVLMSPPTIYYNRDTMLAFKGIGLNSAKDKVRVKPAYRSSKSEEWKELQSMTNDDANGVKEFDATAMAAFHYNFPETGNFEVEYKKADSDYFVSVAHIVIYGGNPAYFRIVSGSDPHGLIYLNKPFTIRFYGDDLNTMQGMDQVKFVNWTDNCNAPGVKTWDHQHKTDLGPGDEESTRISEATFKLSLHGGGAFRVCYKLGNHDDRPWHDVANYDDLDHVGPITDAPAGSIPVPTHSGTHKRCKLAPKIAHPMPKDALISLTLKSSHIPTTLLMNLADILCINPDAIIQTPPSMADNYHAKVTFDIVCHSAVQNRNFKCDGQERKEYLRYMWSDKIKKDEIVSLGVIDVSQQAKGMMVDTIVEPTDAPHTKHGHPVASALTVIIILGLIGGALYLFKDKIVSNVPRRQGQFQPIGTIDDEDDDAGNAPATATVQQGTVVDAGRP